jgi:penicillin-binding protein 1B
MTKRSRRVAGCLLRILAFGLLDFAILTFALVAWCWKDLRVLQQQAAVSASSHYPDVVVDSFLAVEDPGFRSRPHRNLFSLIRFIRGLRTDRRGDASTLLQQVVKMNLRQGRALSWACRSIIVAIIADFLIPRERIINMYLDEVYMGSPNRRPSYGVRAGAQAYFHKSPEQLDVSEAATLAAMVSNPNYYSPILHPGRVQKRRDLVLSLICEYHFASCNKVIARGTCPEALR